MRFNWREVATLAVAVAALATSWQTACEAKTARAVADAQYQITLKFLAQHERAIGGLADSR